MKKILPVFICLFLAFSPLFAHNEEKIAIQTENCVLSEIWLSEESDISVKISRLKETVQKQKTQNLSVPQLDSENKAILDKILAETDPEKISGLLLQHLEIESSANLYSRDKLAQLNTILILIVNVFVIATIWLTFISNSSKNKAKKEKILNTQILEAQERERQRIGQELHDTITQDIRTSLLYVRELKENPCETAYLEKIEEIETSNLKTLRNIISNLSSAEIETEEFGKLISQHCSTVTENTKIPCTFFSAPDIDFSILTTIQKLNIYRIIQEAVNNSLKHAEASSISIIVRKDSQNNKLIFFISDDGKGMQNSDKTEKTGHYGISGMKNRAAMINANLFISSSTELGTEIKLVLPL